jgi:hypothetical protein
MPQASRSALGSWSGAVTWGVPPFAVESLEEPPAGVWAASWRGREGVRRLAPFRGDERDRPNRGYERPGRRTVRNHRSANHRSSMVVRGGASRKDGRTGRRSKLTRAGSSGTLSHDDALPRRIRTTSRTAPRGCGRRRHRAHLDSPLLGEIDAHAPPGRTRRPRPHQRCVPGRTEREEHHPMTPDPPTTTLR